ncbi:hypothetical protein C8R43DRAFT_1118602 [Mycena crocata]|nr:hypothetical protein C8R43DRAFT_1118602 [Mycena crocata]
MRFEMYDGNWSPVIVLNCLTLPNLRHLGISIAERLDVVRALVARSSCVLDHLDLFDQGDIYDVKEVSVWMHTFSSVQTLELDAWADMSTLVHELSSDPALLPHLRKLTLSTVLSDYEDIDYDRLAEMLRTEYPRLVSGIR